VPVSTVSSRPFEILVVDDDPDVRELFVEHLREKGHRVAAASDGRAAIGAIEREPSRYRLIITDLQLPGADGIAVLQAARAANPSACVIIITGYASLDSAIQAVRLGAYDYLTKPFSVGQIDLIVDRVIERFALEAENRELSRQLQSRDSDVLANEQVSIMSRLQAIDDRLARVEALVMDLVRRAGRH
jgi:DNA-binding NtrC family response regulator